VLPEKPSDGKSNTVLTQCIGGQEVQLIFDSATIAAIVVIVILFIFVIATVRASERRTEEKLRRMVHQSHLLLENDEARKLARTIRQEHPDACPGLDFTLKENGNGVHLDAWYSKKPKPKCVSMPTQKNKASSGT